MARSSSNSTKYFTKQAIVWHVSTFLYIKGLKNLKCVTLMVLLPLYIIYSLIRSGFKPVTFAYAARRANHWDTPHSIELWLFLIKLSHPHLRYACTAFQLRYSPVPSPQSPSLLRDVPIPVEIQYVPIPFEIRPHPFWDSPPSLVIRPMHTEICVHLNWYISPSLKRYSESLSLLIYPIPIEIRSHRYSTKRYSTYHCQDW